MVIWREKEINLILGDKRSFSNTSKRGGLQNQEDETIAYADQMRKNEIAFQIEQKQFLNSEYQKQKMEKEMMRSLERDQKMQVSFSYIP